MTSDKRWASEVVVVVVLKQLLKQFRESPVAVRRDP
jgi:hypothetical protein